MLRQHRGHGPGQNGGVGQPLPGSLLKRVEQAGPQSCGLRHVDRQGQRDVRCRKGTIGHALGNDLAGTYEWDHLFLPCSRQRYLDGWGHGRRSSRLHRGRWLLGKGQNVGLVDPATRPATGHQGQVDAHPGRQAPRDRRGPDFALRLPSDVRSGCRGCDGLWGSCFLRQRSDLGLGHRFGHRFCRSGSGSGRRLFARLQDVPDHLRDGDHVIGLGRYAPQQPAGRRLDLDAGFVGHDDKERITLLNLVPFLLEPLDKGARLHDHIHFGHDDCGCHSYLPSRASALAAATMSSTWGTAAASRVRL